MKYTDGRTMFGKKVIDKVSGFVGIITGFCQFSHKQDEFLVSKKIENGDTYEELWFTSERLDFF